MIIVGLKLALALVERGIPVTKVEEIDSDDLGHVVVIHHGQHLTGLKDEVHELGELQVIMQPGRTIIGAGPGG